MNLAAVAFVVIVYILTGRYVPAPFAQPMTVECTAAMKNKAAGGSLDPVLWCAPR